MTTNLRITFRKTGDNLEIEERDSKAALEFYRKLKEKFKTASADEEPQNIKFPKLTVKIPVSEKPGRIIGNLIMALNKPEQCEPEFLDDKTAIEVNMSLSNDLANRAQSQICAASCEISEVTFFIDLDDIPENRREEIEAFITKSENEVPGYAIALEEKSPN